MKAGKLLKPLLKIYIGSWYNLTFNFVSELLMKDSAQLNIAGNPQNKEDNLISWSW